MSLANDLCYAVTGGKCTVIKHLLLSMTLQHITGIALIVTMINRFGHCASYSRVLELESAICRSTDLRNSLIAPTIIDTNIVTHLCWDNFDLLEGRKLPPAVEPPTKPMVLSYKKQALIVPNYKI